MARGGPINLPTKQIVKHLGNNTPGIGYTGMMHAGDRIELSLAPRRQHGDGTVSKSVKRTW